MTRFIAGCLLVAFAGLASAADAPATLKVLRADRYVDVESGRIVSPAVIVVRGQRIEAVNPASAPTGAMI